MRKGTIVTILNGGKTYDRWVDCVEFFLKKWGRNEIAWKSGYTPSNGDTGTIIDRDFVFNKTHGRKVPVHVIQIKKSGYIIFMERDGFYSKKDWSFKREVKIRRDKGYFRMVMENEI